MKWSRTGIRTQEIVRAKNKLKDARIAKIKNESKVEKNNGCILWIDFSKIAETVGSVEDGQLWNRKGSLKSRANGVATSTLLVDGVFPDSAISPPILMSCSSHTEACNALGTTDGVTSHC